AEDGIRYLTVTGVQTCALPIFAGDTGARRIQSCQVATVIERRCAQVARVAASPGTVEILSKKARPRLVCWHADRGSGAILDRHQIGRASCRERVYGDVRVELLK